MAPLLWRHVGYEWNEAAIALLGLATIITLREGDVDGLGFRTAPEQGWRHWCWFALWCGLWVGVAVIGFNAAAVWAGWELRVPRLDPSNLGRTFLFMCVSAPVIEEIVYRSLITVAVRPILGDTGTIAVSGLAFAAVHHLYGVAGPENQLGGFVLAWVFLRSGTILVPLAMHSAGNFVAIGAQLVNWYLLPAGIP